MANTTPQLDELYGSASDTLKAAIQAAYEMGYRAGGEAAVQNILRAATQIAPAPTREGSLLSSAPSEPKITDVRTHKVHWNSAEARPFPYGAVAGAFREALRSAPPSGFAKEELILRAAEILGADAAAIKYRDTFKRLREGDEMLFLNGRYLPGPHLTAVSRNENGALNGRAASAPETGGVAAPPIENSEGFRLQS